MGWTEQASDGLSTLTIDWMDRLPAPEAVLQLLACKCKRACELPRCECLRNGLKCTDLCTLKDCTNQPEDDPDVAVSNEEDENDDDDDFS